MFMLFYFLHNLHFKNDGIPYMGAKNEDEVLKKHKCLQYYSFKHITVVVEP